MSGDRHTLEYRDMAMVITSPDGVRADFSGAHLRSFLTQQSRDIESLRSELAAAVAERDQAVIERDKLRGALEMHLNLFKKVRAERDQLRAFKQAVEAAPVVAWIWNDELGIAHALPSPKKPVWISNGLSSAMAEIVNLRPLYTAPPAPAAAPQFEAVEVDDAVCLRAWRRWDSNMTPKTGVSEGARQFLAAWRAELGPALGLVSREELAALVEAAYREGYEAVINRPNIADPTGWLESNARRKVMWPKGGEG